METMMENNVEQKVTDYYEQIRRDMKTVLGFVEKHNKQNREVIVASAAQRLQKLVEQKHFEVKDFSSLIKQQYGKTP